MKSNAELLALVRQAVAETLRKKDGVRDDEKIGQDLGAESIDRIDLTFRLEEVVEKSLDEKILFAEPDPTVADLARRLVGMLEEKK
ncbi:MAG: acyl carrier protein [Verrucomicrobia bacterium]|nr:acyl carrier protein [Verrucomicrobiota bacterium]